MPTEPSEPAPVEAPAAEPRPPPAPRRGGRPPQKARGRLGRNQYSRDTVPATNGASSADTPNSPQPGATNGVTNGHDSSDGAAGGKTAKSKNWRLQKVSWNDIRKQASAMQNYIAQRQVDMAGEKLITAPAVQPPAASTNGVSPPEDDKEETSDLEKFKKLSTTEMMDHLSRDLIRWQQSIAQPNEK